MIQFLTLNGVALTWRRCVSEGNFHDISFFAAYNSLKKVDHGSVPFNRKEKSLRHVSMVVKFLDDNKPKIHSKREFALFET